MTHNSKGHHPDFRGAVRSAMLVGGGSAITIAIGLMRNKCIAAILGPSGIAVTAMLTQIFEVGGAATGFGLGASGVRQIAAAQSAQDPIRVARVAKTLRRTVWCTGMLALVLILVLAGPISQFTFETDAYRMPVMFLAFVIFIRALITSQTCILQGSRRIADGVKTSIFGALAALVTYVPFAYFWGTDGIAPGILCATLLNLAISWWYARKISIQPIEHSWADTRAEARNLLTFGLPMMLTSLVGTFSPYFERVVLLKTVGLQELGQYQAAYALTGVAVGFILSAMTADYYPKLMAHLDEPERMNKEVNAQIKISMLFAIPIATWILVASPLLIELLYTSEFTPAVAILAVTALGLVGRIISWPLRLVLMAQGRSALLFTIEVAFALVGLALISVFSLRYGALGGGYAFTAIHLFYASCMVFAAPRVLGVRVSAFNLKITAGTLMLISLLMVNAAYNPVAALRWLMGVCVATVITVICFSYLARHTGWHLPRLLRFGPAPSTSGDA